MRWARIWQPLQEPQTRWAVVRSVLWWGPYRMFEVMDPDTMSREHLARHWIKEWGPVVRFSNDPRTAGQT
jgi:hypothetical protein